MPFFNFCLIFKMLQSPCQDIEEIVFSVYAISSSTEIRFNCSQGEDSLKFAMLMPKTILYHF